MNIYYISECCGEYEADQCAVCEEIMEYEGMCPCSGTMAPKEKGSGEGVCPECMEWSVFIPEMVCGECQEPRPEDARVSAGLKCRVCAYGSN